MERLEIISHRPIETQQLGTDIARLVMPGDILLLIGNLGAGKTCLTQGIARGLGVEEYVTSPSFVLIHQFQGRLPLYHIDLYRLNLPQEVVDLGLDDYLYGKGICVIEWAEKGLSLMPPEYMLIKIDYLNDTERILMFEAFSRHYMEMLDQLKAGKD